MKNRTINTLGTLSALVLSAGLANATIVYQDTFDAADGIGTNTGIGGGLVSGTNIDDADPFDDVTGNAVAQTNSGNRLTWAHTANQFVLNSGFTLTVTFTTAEQADTFPSFTSSFGLVDEVTVTTPAADGVGASGNLNAYLYTDQASLNTVGFSLANRPDHANPEAPGLYTDFGTLSLASSDLNSAIVYGTEQTFTLTVNADGSAAFDLDGTSGTLAAGALSSLFTDSADGAYHFVAYSQGNPGLTLNSVTIDAVPEPSSAALLGLGGIALLLRRRK
ncbi:PEP-CTERM sorting domain-containing protein [Oceaniferula flava]|uniref:PEP-CTERM sorting domain-containing protein n=1 Tax=Oceaniferula flava TaxID=2800421 RepID=UPI002867D103|nr:PEP-CTERM sorting domain-containing protein [Oceaniferula flavus]